MWGSDQIPIGQIFAVKSVELDKTYPVQLRLPRLKKTDDAACALNS